MKTVLQKIWSFICSFLRLLHLMQRLHDDKGDRKENVQDSHDKEV